MMRPGPPHQRAIDIEQDQRSERHENASLPSPSRRVPGVAVEPAPPALSDRGREQFSRERFAGGPQVFEIHYPRSMKSIRRACLCLLTAALASAQNPASPAPARTVAPNAPAQTLASLEQAVKDRTAEWSRLAQGLELSLVRLLPCDPKIAASITQVTKASDARIAAVAAYLDAANQQAQLQTNAARQVLASAQEVIHDLAGEKSDLAPERAALDGQLANLNQSVQRRASLAAPEDALKQVITLRQQRSSAVEAALSQADNYTADLDDLIMWLQARQAALSQLKIAFDAEATRWSAYYAGRLARARTECTISGAATGARPAAKGKQK